MLLHVYTTLYTGIYRLTYIEHTYNIYMIHIELHPKKIENKISLIFVRSVTQIWVSWAFDVLMLPNIKDSLKTPTPLLPFIYYTVDTVDELSMAYVIG